MPKVELEALDRVVLMEEMAKLVLQGMWVAQEQQVMLGEM